MFKKTRKRIEYVERALADLHVFVARTEDSSRKRINDLYAILHGNQSDTSTSGIVGCLGNSVGAAHGASIEKLPLPSKVDGLIAKFNTLADSVRCDGATIGDLNEQFEEFRELFVMLLDRLGLKIDMVASDEPTELGIVEKSDDEVEEYCQCECEDDEPVRKTTKK